MKLNIRKALILLVGLVFLVSTAMTVRQRWQHQQGQEDYSQAQELVGLPELDQPQPPAQPDLSQQPPAVSAPDSSVEEDPAEVWVDPYADALAAMDFTALRQVNPDVLGWILIPNTYISYPLMQGADNDEYLNTTWRGGHNPVGSIFLECQNSADLSDFNTIIYGHRTIDRSMFGSLSDYASHSYWSKHPTVYLTDDSGAKTYTIFAAYEVGVTQDTYRLGFDDDQTKQDFLDFCLAQSVIDTGVVPTVDDHILTLSTCTGNGYDTRWVVQAVRTEG